MSSVTFVMVLAKWSRFKLLNSSKSESGLFGTNQRSHSCNDVKSVTVANSVTLLAASIKVLGAPLDEYLSMDEHVTADCRSFLITYKRCARLRQLNPSRCVAEQHPETVTCPERTGLCRFLNKPDHFQQKHTPLSSLASSSMHNKL